LKAARIPPSGPTGRLARGWLVSQGIGLRPQSADPLGRVHKAPSPALPRFAGEGAPTLRGIGNGIRADRVPRRMVPIEVRMVWNPARPTPVALRVVRIPLRMVCSSLRTTWTVERMGRSEV
jgi:hypothetical protein